MSFLAIPLITLSLALGLNAGRSGASALPQPIWQVDLHSFGYDGYKPNREFRTGPTLHPLCFPSNGVLIVSFLKHDATTALMAPDRNNGNLPLKLHAIFLSAEAGTVQATKTWPTPHPHVDVIPARNGQFAVLLPGKLTLYSPDIEPLKELSIPLPPPPLDPPYDMASPQGESAVLGFSGKDSHIDWINTDNLRILGSWKEPMTTCSVSDRQLAICQEEGFVSEVILRDVTGAERLLCRDRDNCGLAQFVNDNLLCLVRTHSLRLMTTSRQMLFSQDFPEDDYIATPMAISSNGQRFAEGVWAPRGGNFDTNFRTLSKRVMVFNVPTRQWIYILSAKEQKLKAPMSVALSPDGTLMAILDPSAIVRVYRLPDAPSPP